MQLTAGKLAHVNDGKASLSSQKSRTSYWPSRFAKESVVTSKVHAEASFNAMPVIAHSSAGGAMQLTARVHVALVEAPCFSVPVIVPAAE
jgi:hypothetical protein